MQFDGAVICEQGVTFAVVAVKKHILDYAPDTADAMENFSDVFPGMPVVLMAQDGRGRPTYYGRRDIVNFLSRVSPGRIPWRRYTLN